MLFEPPTLLRSARRYSSLKHEPYILPRIVIDLDARNSKFVRKLEEPENEIIELDDADKKKLRLKKQWLESRAWPARHRQRTDATPIRKYFTRKPATVMHNFETTVTAPDILSYVLRGGPLETERLTPSAKTTEFHHLRLRKLFKERGIHPLDEEETKITRLIQGHDSRPSVMLDKMGLLLQEQAILKAIHYPKSWSALHRLVIFLSLSRDGCAFLAQNGRTIVQGIIHCRNHQESDCDIVSIDQVLIFLNHLSTNMSSKGFKIGENVCNLGIYLASKADILPAVKSYLKTSQDATYPTNWHAEQAISHLAARSKRNQLAVSKSLTSARNSDLDDLRLLLTGWSQDDDPSSGIERQPSFADLLTHGYSRSLEVPEIGFHGRYLLVLGELGYKRILLYEWQRLGDPQIPDSRSQLPTARSSLVGQHISAIAFLLAKNRSQALSILETIPRSSQDANKVNSASNNVDITSLPLSLFSAHYFFHGLKMSYRHRKRVKEAIPEDPEQALDAIDNLLVKDYFADPGRQQKVEWATVDGVQGILVKDGDAHRYFKPALRAG